MISFKKFSLDLVRHATPLFSLYLLDGSVPRYLLLTAFNLALGMVLIVALTRATTDPTTIDPRAARLRARLASILILSVFFAFAAAFITVPIFSAALIFTLQQGADWGDLLSHGRFWFLVAFVSLIAASRAQLGFEATTVVGKKGTSPHAAPVVGDLAQDRKHSKAQYAAQVTLVATFVFMSFALSYFGEWGLHVLPIAYSVLLLFYDT